MKILLSILLMNPASNILLMLFIIGGLVLELKAPGKLFPMLASLLAALLYFLPYYWAGTVQTWELCLFVVGVVLLMLEIFVIPGFGVVGIAGFAAVFAALGLVTLNNHYLDFSQVSSGQISQALFTTLAGALGSILLLLVTAQALTHTTWFKKVSLQTVLSSEAGYHTKQLDLEQLIGEKGVVYTVLRPSGKILVHHTIYDASTQNKFVEKGTLVEIVGVKGNSLVVQPFTLKA